MDIGGKTRQKIEEVQRVYATSRNYLAIDLDVLNSVNCIMCGTSRRNED